MDTIQNIKTTLSALIEVRRLLQGHITECDVEIAKKVKDLQTLELSLRNDKELETAKESMQVAKTLSVEKVKKKKSTRTRKSL